jgi:hypothetical protein
LFELEDWKIPIIKSREVRAGSRDWMIPPGVNAWKRQKEAWLREQREWAEERATSGYM